MKVFFLTMLIFVLGALPAASLSYSIKSDGTVGLVGDGISCVVSRESILIKHPSFSFGAVGDGGIIHYLDHPFSSASLSPSFSSFSSLKSETGSAFRFNGFTFFSFFGERDGAGIMYEGERWKAGAVYSSPSDDTSYQKNPVSRTDRHTLWGWGDYDGEHLSARVVTSISGKFLFSTLFIAALKIPSLEISYGHGTTAAFSENGDEWESCLSASLSSLFFSVSHELRYARTPVYIGEYRDYEYRIRARMEIQDFTLSDSVTKSFVSGRTKREERISLSWRSFTVGIKIDDRSLFASAGENGVSFEWEDGKAGVKITRTIVSGSGAFSFSLSSSGVSSWIYTRTL